MKHGLGSVHGTRYVSRGTNSLGIANINQQNPTIRLPTVHDADHDIADIMRQITITVAVPRTHVVNTATLKLSNTSASTTSSPFAAVGDMLPATLTISHTRKWGDPISLQKLACLDSADDALDFVFDTDANPDVWLIGGQRRVHFSARENEELTFPIMLMPLRPGRLLLPSVDVRYVPKQSRPVSGGGRMQGVEGEEISVETDYQSMSEHVTVISNVQSTTVGLQMGPGGGSAVLLETA